MASQLKTLKVNRYCSFRNKTNILSLLAFASPTTVIHLSQEVTKPYSELEISGLVQEVAGKYGIDDKDVTVDIDYEVSGSLTLGNVDPIKIDAVEDTVRNSISQQTGVPISDVDVDYNSDTGVVEYKVKTDSYEESSGIQADFTENTFSDEIGANLKTVDNNIDVISAAVNDSIVSNFNIVADVEDSSVDLKDVTDKLRTEFLDDGFTVTKAEGTF